MTSPKTPLLDRFGRVHDSLRVSVTDRCNIRCFYCMPETDVPFMPREELLSFEEITRVVQLMVERFGVNDLRITGGEPLVRRDLPALIAMLAAIPDLSTLAMTTNGILLADHAVTLRDAGLQKLNISLDTLDEATFQQITRRKGVHRVIEGIDAAIAAGFESIKLNALAIAGIAEQQLVPLLTFAFQRGCVLRFIEFMPLDGDQAWTRGAVLSGDRLLTLVEKHFGSVQTTGRQQASQPAEQFRVRDGEFGIIRSVTRPFCQACNRLRLTADGAVRNCLFARDETPLRDAIRSGQSDDQLAGMIRDCVSQKRAAHGIDDKQFTPPERPMYSIGG